MKQRYIRYMWFLTVLSIGQIKTVEHRYKYPTEFNVGHFVNSNMLYNIRKVSQNVLDDLSDFNDNQTYGLKMCDEIGMELKIPKNFGDCQAMPLTTGLKVKMTNDSYYVNMAALECACKDANRHEKFFYIRRKFKPQCNQFFVMKGYKIPDDTESISLRCTSIYDADSKILYVGTIPNHLE